MPFVSGSSDGVLSGASAVTLVPAPSKNTRRIVKTIIIGNVDTASVTLTVRVNNNGSMRRAEPAKSVPPNGTWTLSSPIVLDSTTKSIEAFLSGAPATSNPEFVSSWADES